jgi:uncharacterized protein (DUF2062 family)
MLRKYCKRILPTHESVRQNRWLRPFSAWLHHPNLWHLHRRSVAGGVAVGMFTGLIPGPFQMITAVLFAVLFRVNLPVAIFATFYTNPLTIIPLYIAAYGLGSWVTGHSSDHPAAQFTIPQMDWSNWGTVTLDWVLSLGTPFAVGLPLLATLLAIGGYVVVRVLWRVMVVVEVRRRSARRAKIDA